MIIDSFIFFNELDVLEIRLHELDSVVDRFLIVEAPETFSGKKKPLHYQENADRFSAFAHKITHVNTGPLRGRGCWDKETWQRNGITRALHGMGLHDDDIVIVSDADEVPSAAAISSYKKEMGPTSVASIHSHGMANLISYGRWGGTVMSPWSYAKNVDAQMIRHGPKHNTVYGGWHLAYLGGYDAIRAKVGAYSHQELNNDSYLNDVRLMLLIGCGVDFQGRNDADWHYVPLVEGEFPDHLVRNKERFKHLWRDASFTERWIGGKHLESLAYSVLARKGLEGDVLDLGCWEGRSTIALALAAAPEKVIAVDDWRETPPGRDIAGTFLKNIEALTPGNVEVRHDDVHEFLKCWGGPIKLAHIDADHSREGTEAIINKLLPLLVKGGVLVGDDFETAEGVREAVQKLLPGYGQSGNQWWFTRE